MTLSNPMLTSRRPVNVSFILIVALLAAAGAWLVVPDRKCRECPPDAPLPTAETEAYTVRGASMEPLVSEGSEVTIVPADGHEIGRDDIVTVRVGFSETPIIKIVKGLPGDTLALAPADDGTFRILVNGASARNSEDVPYAVDTRGYRMLSLYVADYDGVIPPEAYLVLGDQPGGTLDSTRFGLVHRTDILGTVAETTSP